MKTRVFISIGSNIEAEQNIRKVKAHLDSSFSVTYSSIYKTAAKGFQGEDFLNLVCSFDTDLEPLGLREFLKEIEIKMGRSASQKGMSNRVIDLDLILYGNKIIKTELLDIPSSDILKYEFVLKPLCELAGTQIHPETQKTFNSILESF